MKKLKKLFAVMLSLIMVLAMGITSFADEAAPTATITLTNFDNAGSLKYMQIIEPDQTQPTGWKFSNGVAKNAFTAVTGKTEQETLWMLILNKDDQARNNTELNIPTGLVAITNSQIDSALSTIKSNKDAKWTVLENKNSLTVNKAGVYAFDAEADNYTYKVATAYVGFGTYNVAPTLQDTSVTAKRSEISIEKTTPDLDNAVAIGDTVDYTITTFVPYIDANADNRTFKITDEITGADYVKNEAGKVVGTITLGKGESAQTVSADITPAEDGKSFEIDLTSLVTSDNVNGGKEITVTYKAKVTATTVTNIAYGHKSGSEYDSSTINLYTGYITLTKTDADTQNPKPLADAEFEVRKVVGNESGDALRFDYDEENNVYIYNPNSKRQNPTVVVTGQNGRVTIKGLNVGTYHFKETKAPSGYSINEDGADATLTVTEKATEEFTTATDITLKDSKLSALPETGGIGTTIFTIVGCGIMIAAAGLFFASRRKENR